MFYNEFDPFAAEWLRNLIATKELPGGFVDERSIKDITTNDLAGHDAVHLFAGVGGWPFALRQAGWPDERPVWTGSCPCQPFSVAGKRGGESDERHLWPDMFRLIATWLPPTIFGEQVASKAGRNWLAGVRADLENLGYEFGAADLCAPGIPAPFVTVEETWQDEDSGEACVESHRRTLSAPHIRQRLFWVAVLQHENGRGRVESIEGQTGSGRDRSSINDSDDGGIRQSGDEVSSLSEQHQLSGAVELEEGRTTQQPGGAWSDFRLVGSTDGKTRRVGSKFLKMVDGVPQGVGHLQPELVRFFDNEVLSYAKSCKENPEEILRNLWLFVSEEAIRKATGGPVGIHAPEVLLAFLCQLAREGWQFSNTMPFQSTEDAAGFLRELWCYPKPPRTSCELRLPGQSPLQYSDSVRKLSSLLALTASRVWPSAYHANAGGCSPLTNTLPRGCSKGLGEDLRKTETSARRNRVGRIRGYGNAIVWQLAAEFVAAFLETESER